MWAQFFVVFCLMAALLADRAWGPTALHPAHLRPPPQSVALPPSGAVPRSMLIQGHPLPPSPPGPHRPPAGWAVTLTPGPPPPDFPHPGHGLGLALGLSALLSFLPLALRRSRVARRRGHWGMAAYGPGDAVATHPLRWPSALAWAPTTRAVRSRCVSLAAGANGSRWQLPKLYKGRPNNMVNPHSPVAKGTVNLCHDCGKVLDKDMLCPECDYNPDFPRPSSSAAKQMPVYNDPLDFEGPATMCFQCHMQYEARRRQCPKCDYGIYEQNTTRYLSVDIAHRNQTVDQATQQFWQTMALAKEQRYAGVLFVCGQSKIGEQVQALLFFLWAKSRIRSYAPLEKNPGSWIVRLLAEGEPGPKVNGFRKEFWEHIPPYKQEQRDPRRPSTRRSR